MAGEPISTSRKLVLGSVLLGLFVLVDLGLLGWFIFRSLSERDPRSSPRSRTSV